MFSASPALTIRFKGVRGSIPSPGFETAGYGGNTSCVELRCGEEILILDAGTGIRSLGAELREEFGSRPLVANLLISHTHWDHIQGLPFFSPLYAAQNRIRLVSANGEASDLERALRNQMQSLHFPVTLDEMRGVTGFAHLESEYRQLGEFGIETIALNHPGGCAGFRIAARGANIAYLPDHEPYRHARNGADAPKGAARKESLLRFLHGVELLILDTQYTEAEYRERTGWGHGCLTDSVALAMEAGVRRLFLFHHDPSHGDKEIDEMLREARRLAGSGSLEIAAAAENEVVTLQSALGNGSSNGHFHHSTQNGTLEPILVPAARRKVSFRRTV